MMDRFYQDTKPFSRASWAFIGVIVAGALIATAAMLFAAPAGGGWLLLAGYLFMAVGTAGLMASVVMSLMKGGKDGRGR